MAKSNVIPIEHILAGVMLLSLFTWFTTSAILNDEIRMGGKVLPIEVVTRAEHPGDYWTSVIIFSIITLFGWFAIGLNAYRRLRIKRKSEPPK